IPSQLKAWIDRIAIAGKTFRYTADGPEGLAGGKRVIIASSRGGIYSKGPGTAADFQEAYLRQVLAFIGISDPEIIRAEGLNLGTAQREAALAKAHAQIADELRAAA
ncbi:MAG TPA: NAD(P)H-dependent oxidoreductase, partial [Rhodanobacteraceae bacterium]|nr:NAD(P)H-dependent oxidoreductase [Rhodanobacteraceae bacterium]